MNYRNQMMGADQPELAQTISGDATFSAIADEVAHERKTQTMKSWYTYVLNDSIVGGQTLPFSITIEQGTDFKCCYLTASAFSYDGSEDSAFPIPNSGAVTWWAGRGLTVSITDTRAGRELTSGLVPFELFATPGYGLSFNRPFPLRYFFLRNTKIKFQIKNLDKSTRTHTFAIALHGFKYLTPGA